MTIMSTPVLEPVTKNLCDCNHWRSDYAYEYFFMFNTAEPLAASGFLGLLPHCEITPMTWQTVSSSLISPYKAWRRCFFYPSCPPPQDTNLLILIVLEIE